MSDFIGADGYFDSDAAFNAQYWSGRARVAEAAESNRRRMFATKGMRVEVTGGRKYKGEVGVVFWVGESQFGPGYRVGLKTDDGRTAWAAYHQVELVGDWSWDGESFSPVGQEVAA